MFNPYLSVWHNFVNLIGHITVATVAAAFVWNFAVIPVSRWIIRNGQAHQMHLFRIWMRQTRVDFYPRPLWLEE